MALLAVLFLDLVDDAVEDARAVVKGAEVEAVGQRLHEGDLAVLEGRELAHDEGGQREQRQPQAGQLGRSDLHALGAQAEPEGDERADQHQRRRPGAGLDLGQGEAHGVRARQRDEVLAAGHGVAR